MGERFEIAESVAKEGVGDEGFEKLLKLQDRLYRLPDGSNSPLTLRIAPSIMARSEAELFGISMPRFAVRAYLEPSRKSFINLRRMKEFARRAAHRGWMPIGASGLKYGEEVFVDVAHPERPSDMMLRNDCIGDSVLVPPEDILEDFFVITAELGLAYGEGQEIWATPFVRPIRCPGGGLCAQACCFMANALLHGYPSQKRRRSSHAGDDSDTVTNFAGVHGVA